MFLIRSHRSDWCRSGCRYLAGIVNRQADSGTRARIRKEYIHKIECVTLAGTCAIMRICECVSAWVVHGCTYADT